MDERKEDSLDFNSTAELKVSDKLIGQVIGQDNSVEIVKKAAAQKRNVLLVGLPGTGKSMLAQAMAEILPVSELHDILIYPNKSDPNNPRVRAVKAGEGKKIVQKARMESRAKEDNARFMGFILPLGFFIVAGFMWRPLNWIPDVVYAATLILGGFLMVGFALGSQMKMRSGTGGAPKLLIDNSGKKTAPFTEGTGARAGALLGDVRHDPLQTFFPNTVVYAVKGNRIEKALIKDVVEKLLHENSILVNKTEKDYEALVVPEDRIIEVLGFAEGKIVPVKLLGVNKKTYSGKMVKIERNGRTLIVTPEHKILAGGKFIEAEKLNGSEKLVIRDEPILEEEAIINTFSEFDRNSARDYYRYLAIKNSNPSFGYKRIAKILGIPQGRVRWWHSIGSKPKAVKTIDFLKELELIPLQYNDSRLPVIAGILGATFGDGGIAGNLNNIFLSSSEENSLEEFKQDMISVFGEQILENFSTIKSGQKGTGRCIRNTNRAAIRFFAALGAPVGRKDKELLIPRWIYLNEKFSREFFGAFLGNELCSPKFSEKHKYINDFAVALCGKEKLKENRLKFLSELSDFLASYGIKTTSVYENNFRKDSFMWKLGISKELENIARFNEFIKLSYSNSKQKRIEEALSKLYEWKKIRKEELEASNKSSAFINSLLRISVQLMEQIAAKKDFEDSTINYKGTIYNITTSSGNILANNIIASNSGGLGTPPHLRVEPGLIHKVSGGVLFLDEIATLSPKAQQELLTAMQEKKYSITGQSELSSGAMTKTDPVPCFPAETCLLTAKGNVSMGAFIDSILSKNYDRVTVGNGAEVFDLNEKEDVITYLNSKIIPSNVERVYRRKYSGKVLKIKFDDGTELIATPDHPIKTVNDFVKAKDLKVNDVVEATDGFIIIDEKAIVNTYCKDNQRIADAFNKWIASGKKLSAKELGVDYKTIFSWKKGSTPHALKSVNQLNRKKLLPLNLNDERLSKIARVAGALFGDGGIDGRRLSRVYFSTDSNSIDDLNEFKNDILSIFGGEINSAITIKKITSKGGSGLDLSINNSCIARFFYALGVPKGDKVSQSFTVPFWVKLSDKLEKEFFSALLCCELYGNIRSSQDTISFVMAKLKKFDKEHIEFLNEIRNFLLKNRVEVKEVEQDKEYFKTKGLPNPEIAGAYLFKLNSGYKNIIQLANIINFYYAKNKKSAILNVVKNGKIFIESQKHLNSLKEEALMLRNAGKTIHVIAKEMGLCKNTVWKIVGKTYNKYSKLDRKRVFGLLGKGIIPKIVAKKLEIPYTTVLYWKNNYFSGEV